MTEDRNTADVPITLECSECGHPFTVIKSRIGTGIQCPRCYEPCKGAKPKSQKPALPGCTASVANSVFLFFGSAIVLAAGAALGLGVIMCTKPDESWGGAAMMICIFGPPLAAIFIAAGLGCAPDKHWTTPAGKRKYNIHLAWRDGQKKALWESLRLVGWLFSAVAAFSAYKHVSNIEKQRKGEVPRSEWKQNVTFWA